MTAAMFCVAGLVVAFMLANGLDQTAAKSQSPDGQDPAIAGEARDDDLEVAAKGEDEKRVEALLRLTDGRFTLDQMVPVLARATVDRDELVRAAGEVGIQRVGKKAVPALQDMVGEGFHLNLDFAAVCGAAKVLGTDAVDLFPELQKALASDDAPVQKMALFAMQNLGDENTQAMDRMIELMSSKDMNVRIAVCRVLEQLGPKAAPAIDQLVELYKNGVISDRSWATVVLGAIGESDQHDILEILTEQLDAFTQVEKQRAMIGLGHLGSKAKPALQKVTELMKDPSKNCQAQAAVTIWQITGDPEICLNVLKALLPSIDYKFTVLEHVANLGPVAGPLAEVVAKELDAEDVGIRELAVVALGKIGPDAKATIPQLKKLLSDDDALLRQAVTDAIKAIEKESTEPSQG